MRNFFTGAKPVSKAEVSSINGGGREGGQSAVDDRSGKFLSALGNQQKSRNFENFGTFLGQHGILKVSSENGSVLNGKVLVTNGRPTWAFTFKLTPDILALRVCKLEGGKCSVSVLGAKSSRWPKALSDRPDLLKQSGGLVKAHPVDKITSLKGIMVKPNSSKATVDSQSWATGESSRGTWRATSGSSVTDEVLATATVGPEPPATETVDLEPPAIATMDPESSATATVDPESPVTTAMPESESEGSFFGFSGAVGSNRRLWDETAWPTGPGFDVSSTLNSFSPLLGLGCEEGLCFGEKDDSTVGFGEKGVIQSNPIDRKSVV